VPQRKPPRLPHPSTTPRLHATGRQQRDRPIYRQHGGEDKGQWEVEVTPLRDTTHVGRGIDAGRHKPRAVFEVRAAYFGPGLAEFDARRARTEPGEDLRGRGAPAGLADFDHTDKAGRRDDFERHRDEVFANQGFADERGSLHLFDLLRATDFRVVVVPFVDRFHDQFLGGAAVAIGVEHWCVGRNSRVVTVDHQGERDHRSKQQGETYGKPAKPVHPAKKRNPP
jgi:hypothetical protein